ncbi:MAG: hypothetical protein ACO1G7_00015 [Bacteroidota bacterium]|jgi:hypothetical protein|nr:hypothetical protein [Bacteroidia bacterium]MBP7772945.1 hypothetical protein [Bacteroidia bacterium]HRU60240.1 hypothetical protein [Bacteroidia bacterium]
MYLRFMLRRRSFFLLSLVLLLSSGCGIFKKKCDCPRFGSAENRIKHG